MSDDAGDGDIVFDLLQRLKGELGDDVLTDELVAKIDIAIRKDWGGDRAYIIKTSVYDKKITADEVKVVVAKVGVAKAVKETGISRSTIFRMLKK